MASDKIRDLTASSIFTGIGHLKDQHKFCDLKITIEGKTFSCHRVVLASVSKFFKTSILLNVRKNSLARVQLDHKDVSHTMFQSLLEILYEGKDVITEETVQDFLKMSSYLQINFLTNYCVKFLRNNLQPKDCLGLWQFAQRYRLPNLAAYCSRCAAENINTLPQDELLALPKSMLFVLFSLQNNLSMDDVCKTILRWVECDRDTRSGFLSQFIPFISFPHLSRAYLADLIEYRDHPFSEHVKDSIVLALKNSDETHAQTCLKILCQQSFAMKNTDIISVSVIIKATHLPLEHGPTLEAWSDMDQRYVLAPVPKNSGCHFATCTWRNEIYLSGGTLLPTFFAVYTPGENTWYVLPPLDADRGREKHAMAAVNNNIYVLGGLTKRSENTKFMSSDVQRYEITSKKWSLVCLLPEAVQDTSAAVLGHRIYLFGGVNAKGVNSVLVQCVDTVNNVAYVAGKLPSCTSGTRALSNNGVIWVVLRAGQVLQMWEDFHLADEKEQQLAITKNKITDDKPMKKASILDVTNVSSRSSDTGSISSSISTISSVSGTVSFVSAFARYERRERVQLGPSSMFQMMTTLHNQKRDQADVPLESTSIKSLPVTTFRNPLDNEEQLPRPGRSLDYSSTSDSPQSTPESRKRTHPETEREDEDYLTSYKRTSPRRQTEMLGYLEYRENVSWCPWKSYKRYTGQPASKEFQ